MDNPKSEPTNSVIPLVVLKPSVVQVVQKESGWYAAPGFDRTRVESTGKAS